MAYKTKKEHENVSLCQNSDDLHQYILNIASVYEMSLTLCENPKKLSNCTCVYLHFVQLSLIRVGKDYS